MKDTESRRMIEDLRQHIDELRHRQWDIREELNRLRDHLELEQIEVPKKFVIQQKAKS